MKHYPVYLDLDGKKVVVVGGGRVALRKVQRLVEAGARCLIVSPDLHSELQRTTLMTNILKVHGLLWQPQTHQMSRRRSTLQRINDAFFAM